MFIKLANTLIKEYQMDSLISWIGGKKQLRQIISDQIPSDINGYIEVFGGAGWILFYKEKWADVEVYNDIDSRLTNLFLVVKYHPAEMKKELEFMIHSRSLFEEIREQKGLTDIQQAARFFYLIKRSFGSQGDHFGRSAKSNPAKSLNNMLRHVQHVSDRLDRVTLENRDYREILEFYDLEKNFFFLDPPYRQGHQYKSGRMDYEDFIERLKNLKARFLLTLDDHPKNRKLFKQFNIQPIERVNGINRKNIVNNIYKELIIKNY